MTARRAAVAAAVLCFAPAAPPSAVADVATLKSGGEVRGEFVGDPRAGDVLTLRTAAGAVVSVRRADVRSWAYRDAAREAFERRFDRTPDDPAAWNDLAQWALENRLRSERRRALERVVQLDPYDEPARLSLGHKRDGNEWVTPAEWRRRRGLVLYDGRAVSPEERRLLRKADADDAARRGWYREVKLLVRNLSRPGGPGRRGRSC